MGQEVRVAHQNLVSRKGPQRHDIRKATKGTAKKRGAEKVKSCGIHNTLDHLSGILIDFYCLIFFGGAIL